MLLYIFIFITVKKKYYKASKLYSISVDYTFCSNKNYTVQLSTSHEEQDRVEF